jgi:hypothetical protein
MSVKLYLTNIKADSDLKTIPVVILTTSAVEADTLEHCELHTNCPVGRIRSCIIRRNVCAFVNGAGFSTEVLTTSQGMTLKLSGDRPLVRCSMD